MTFIFFSLQIFSNHLFSSSNGVTNCRMEADCHIKYFFWQDDFAFPRKKRSNNEDRHQQPDPLAAKAEGNFDLAQQAPGRDILSQNMNATANKIVKHLREERK